MVETLLEGSVDINQRFISSDTQELFKENIIKQSEDWIWRHKSVRYTQNSQKYRAAEWTDCDWNNSILVFGCSLVFGVGIDDQDTLTSQLSKNLNVPVINLGQPGTAIGFIWANTILLKSCGIKPKACIYVWPDISRQNEFLSDYVCYNHGSWNIDGPFGNLIMNETHNQIYYKYMIQNIKLLWDCPVIEATYYANISQKYDCQLLEFEDKARDLLHPGPKSTKLAADILAKRLNSSR